MKTFLKLFPILGFPNITSVVIALLALALAVTFVIKHHAQAVAK